MSVKWKIVKEIAIIKRNTDCQKSLELTTIIEWIKIWLNCERNNLTLKHSKKARKE